MITAYNRAPARIVSGENQTLKSVDVADFFGLPTDAKPTQNVANGSRFFEMFDGGWNLYLFDEENGRWLQVSGGDT